MFQRKHGQLNAAGDSQLVENVRQMVFYRSFADAEFLAHLFVGRSIGDLADNLQLMRGKAKVPGSWTSLLRGQRLPERLNENGNTLAVNPVLAGNHATNAVE